MVGSYEILPACGFGSFTDQIDLNADDNILICDSQHSGRTARAGKEATQFSREWLTLSFLTTVNAIVL